VSVTDERFAKVEEQQLPLKWEAYLGGGKGEAPTAPKEGYQAFVAPYETEPGPRNLMEEAVEEENLTKALKKVLANKGAPGVDGMTVEELPDYLSTHWGRIREELLSATYKPAPVSKVDIPKREGGTRTLGIPIALDRLIQQMILQVLTPILEPIFSESSYGYRPRRSAKDAVEASRGYVEDGYEWIVDLDIEAFFDRVNHDKLMGKLAQLVTDKRLLKLVRAYLNAGVMDQGVVVRRYQGTPQGGPLSPLLSNLYLTELDRELEQRGHKFCRYADNAYIFVRSERAGQRVLGSITDFLRKRLQLTVNRDKSVVDWYSRRSILSFSLWSKDGKIKVRISPKALKRAKGAIRKRTQRSKGISLEEMIERLNIYLKGWVAYFSHAETPSVFDDLDAWVRRRLRCVIWKSWKRAKTRFRELRARGVRGKAVFVAGTRKGPWRIAGSPPLQYALPNTFFAKQGLVSLRQRYLELVTLRTAECV